MPRLEIVAVFEVERPLTDEEKAKMNKAMRSWERMIGMLGAKNLVGGVKGKFLGMEVREVEGDKG